MLLRDIKKNKQTKKLLHDRKNAVAHIIWPNNSLWDLPWALERDKSTNAADCSCVSDFWPRLIPPQNTKGFNPADNAFIAQKTLSCHRENSAERKGMIICYEKLNRMRRERSEWCTLAGVPNCGAKWRLRLSWSFKPDIWKRIALIPPKEHGLQKPTHYTI